MINIDIYRVAKNNTEYHIVSYYFKIHNDKALISSKKCM